MVKFNTKLSYAYMDELFHIPQAQKYCKGIFNEVRQYLTWDFIICISYYR